MLNTCFWQVREIGDLAHWLYQGYATRAARLVVLTFVDVNLFDFGGAIERQSINIDLSSLFIYFIYLNIYNSDSRLLGGASTNIYNMI